MYKAKKEFLRIIPKKPGIYIFKDSLNSIIYIGKAKNLKNRVSQYFSSKHKNSMKTRFLVKNIDSFEFIVVDNEIEALLLENKMIKKEKPKYNINLKDSKTFPYIKITDEKLPKIQFTRTVTSKGEYFGPFTNGELRYELFNLVIRLFKLISKHTYSSRSKINYEIGLAPAQDLKSIDVSSYRIRVEEAKEFLRGRRRVTQVKKRLKREMSVASEEMKYEVAQEKKKQIEAIEHLKEKQRVDLSFF